MTFAEIVEEHDLKILTKEQRREFCKGFHDFMARAVEVAFSYDCLVVVGGNLDYYAGFEYEKPYMTVETDKGTLKMYYPKDNDDCRINVALDACEYIVRDVEPSAESD